MSGQLRCRGARVDTGPDPGNIATSVGSCETVGEDEDIDKAKWREEFLAHWRK